MSQALDYSLARPSPATIKAKGYVGVLRYVAPAIDAPKIITGPEYRSLLAAGLQVALNWEWYGNRAREGYTAGKVDATEALRQANALGYQGCLYFSVDYDAPAQDQLAINLYFEGVASVIGKARTGAYAGYWPLKRLFDANLITFGWQTVAWSGGNREARAHLYQNGQQALGACDVNDVLKPDWTGAAPMPPQPDYRTQQAEAVWKSTSYPTGTGIYNDWLAQYQKGIVCGSPTSGEIHTVDWQGTPIILQEFAMGVRIEHYPGNGSHGYTATTQLW